MALPAGLGLSQGFSNVNLNCAVSCRGEACVAQQTLKYAVEVMNTDLFFFVRSRICRTGSLWSDNFTYIYIYINPVKEEKNRLLDFFFSPRTWLHVLWRAGCFLDDGKCYSHKGTTWVSTWMTYFGSVPLWEHASSKGWLFREKKKVKRKYRFKVCICYFRAVWLTGEKQQLPLISLLKHIPGKLN